MSLRSPVGDGAAEALRRVRPDLLEVIPRRLTQRQEQALAAWERLGDGQTPAAVADEMGISLSGASYCMVLARSGRVPATRGAVRWCCSKKGSRPKRFRSDSSSII